MTNKIKYFVAGLLLCSACDNLPKLENSPLAIKDIVDIGELVTAEYYGEVYKSLEAIDSSNLKFELAQDFLFFKNTYADFARKSKKQKNIIQEFRQAKYLKDQRFKRLTDISNESNQVFINETLKNSQWSEFSSGNKIALEKYLEKRNRDEKGEIVYLARGWVKAGFDLTAIDFRKSVRYSADTMFIRNLDPIILDTDINPWLIPGKIPGFEIIKMNNKVSLEDIQTVKTMCKAGLKHSAIESGIYEYCLSSGELSFEGLFGLMDLPGVGQINKVIILPTKYFEYKAGFLEDGSIDDTELKVIRELLQRDTVTCDTEWFDTLPEQMEYLEDFIQELYEETSISNNSRSWVAYCDSSLNGW